MTEEQDVTLKAPTTAYKVYIWRNVMRGEIAVAARSEKDARKAILAQNVQFAALLQGEPLVVDPTEKGVIVHRWRRG